MIPVYGTYEGYVAAMKSTDRAVAFSEDQINAYVEAAEARGISFATINSFIRDNPGDFSRIEIALAGPREAVTGGPTYVPSVLPQGGTLGIQAGLVAFPAPAPRVIAPESPIRVAIINDPEMIRDLSDFPATATEMPMVSVALTPAPTATSDPSYQALVQKSTAQPSPSTSGPPGPLGYSTNRERGGLAAVTPAAQPEMIVGAEAFPITLVIIGAILIGLWLFLRK